MALKLKNFFLPVLLLTLAAGAIPPVYAGNGARHPMEGAVFAKYLAPAEVGGGKFKRYGSAFLLGAYSHLLSDQFGNYEPRMKSRRMMWFSAEGLTGAVLLLPQWKKDPALFFGSLGAMAPDLEHSIKLFDKRYFPTHSGALTHGELVHFWHGVLQNLLINGAAYYSIHQQLPQHNDDAPLFRVGWSLSQWQIPGVADKEPFKFQSWKNSSLMRNINLAFDLSEYVSLESGWGTWMKEGDVVEGRDTPTKMVIQSHLLGISLHPRQQPLFNPFITAGAGVYTASQSEAVSRKGIAFARYIDSSFGLHYGAGVRIPLKRGSSIVINQCYHHNTFNKAINGVRSYSGWAGGLALERSY